MLDFDKACHRALVAQFESMGLPMFARSHTLMIEHPPVYSSHGYTAGIGPTIKLGIIDEVTKTEESYQYQIKITLDRETNEACLVEFEISNGSQAGHVVPHYCLSLSYAFGDYTPTVLAVVNDIIEQCPRSTTKKTLKPIVYSYYPGRPSWSLSPIKKKTIAYRNDSVGSRLAKVHQALMSRS